MKKFISLLTALLMLAASPLMIAVYAEEEVTEKNIAEIISDISEDLSEAETETETETTTEPETEPGPIVICYGDVNMDGKVNITDARTVLQFIAKLRIFNEKQIVLADINKNKAVNASDARMILRTAAGIERKIPFNGEVPGSEDVYYSSYDNRKTYTPSVKGFSTNINDERVFSKLKTLENYCASLGTHASVYYTDVKGKYYIKYNSTKVFRTQCTIKAPYIKSILVYMEQNNIPLTRTLTLRASQKWRGHYLSDFATGTKFTIQQLIYYAIRISDNTAYQMLFDYFGNTVFNESAKKAGSSLRLGTYIFGETSPEDMAKLYLDIYNYNGKYRDFLFNEMDHTTTNNLIGGGVPSGIRNIHKWGSGGGMTTGLHDCSIIFTKVPCVLVIYTDFNMTRGGDRVPFRKIASYIVDINQNITYE